MDREQLMRAMKVGALSPERVRLSQLVSYLRGEAEADVTERAWLADALEAIVKGTPASKALPVGRRSQGRRALTSRQEAPWIDRVFRAERLRATGLSLSDAIDRVCQEDGPKVKRSQLEAKHKQHRKTVIGFLAMENDVRDSLRFVADAQAQQALFASQIQSALRAATDFADVQAQRTLFASQFLGSAKPAGVKKQR